MPTSTRNIKPSLVSMVNYAIKYLFGSRYGESLFGGGVYGAGTDTSAGQKMSSTSTRKL